MKVVKLLRTYGDGKFVEEDWIKPDPNDNEIEVKAVITGVCRSDIDMMIGNFPTLPASMSGHEGLGVITKIGCNINDVRPGDIVATRGEPAYADFYNVQKYEYVQVPEAHPRFILEPVACGINAVRLHIQNKNDKILIIGSGFLAWVAYHTLVKFERFKNVDVLGASNQELWNDILLFGTTESYDVIIDLTGKYELGIDIGLNNNAIIVDGVGKAVSQKESQQQLWKSCTTIRPSPRNTNFYQCMKDAVWMLENGYLEVDNFWTQCYNRNTEWQQAFEDGLNRPKNYSRGYIKWD
jgi:threonine dehydrogenase-like Zn-dependent dehydrogenase